MSGNFPDGMSGRDWDHVHGVVRCVSCGTPLPEDCPGCEGTGNKFVREHEDGPAHLPVACDEPDCADGAFTGDECPGGNCAGEDRSDREYDRMVDERAEGADRR